ncbi:sporozoite invasion-associated protein 2, putative [Plasmodium malariae]|uniref:Sporozoite invasion-associated protein 2, putative n=1 Tax=Plasmodium malariae TaxID=5858 RepID=A0A1D3JL22_PLAMA|nr:sporozoite invasion-associated protein 2, putative [Plasmodium malariae]SBT87301.1 sporozoite invasion-associated protein 2, putative [Plasmodium malariae]
MKLLKIYYIFFNLVLFLNIVQLSLSCETQSSLENPTFNTNVDYGPSIDHMFGKSFKELVTSLEEDLLYENYSLLSEFSGSLENFEYVPEDEGFNEIYEAVKNSSKKKSKKKNTKSKNYKSQKSKSSLPQNNEYDSYDSYEELDEDNINLKSYDKEEHNDSEDSSSEYNELEESDDEKIVFGKLQFFNVNNQKSDYTKNIPSHETNASHNKNDTKKSDDENDGMVNAFNERSRIRKRKNKNPFENFVINYTYDDFLVKHNLSDNISGHNKMPGERFALDEFYNRIVKYRNIENYILKLLFDNFKNQNDLGRKYILNNFQEVASFVKLLLRKNFVQLNSSEEEMLFENAKKLLQKTYKKLN